MSRVITSAADRPRVRLGGIQPAVLTVLEKLDPLVITGSLAACIAAYGEVFSRSVVALMFVSFVITSIAFDGKIIAEGLTGEGAQARVSRICSSLLLRWMCVIGSLVFAAFALKTGADFSRRVVLTWFVVTPVLLVGAEALRLRVLRALTLGGANPNSIIIGANSVGRELAHRLPPACLYGFYDFRSPARVAEYLDGAPLLGDIDRAVEFVRKNGVRVVYIALPMSNVPRINALVQALRDTTASIYFVPDAFAFGVIQGRVVDINGMPALSVCESPLHGVDAVIKRAMDLLLTSSLLLLALPLMLAIAVAVRHSGPGPILFRQRRYGLHGEGITVYKFRTMTECEDGARIVQAQRTDHRVTPVGRFLRRTSLDELPQLVNVLQGSMSLVGPRPHAIAHNELYRTLVDGYMIRHKVRPGITGLAQVKGLRGETETVEKMRIRVESDLEYLRDWSIWLDISILLRTLPVIYRRQNAY